MVYPSDGEYLKVGETHPALSAAYGSALTETRLMRKDGSTFEVLLGSSPIDPANPRQQVVFSVVDISRQKKAEAESIEFERQSHQAQKMEALGTLAGGIAHDFNNILAVILGYGEMSQGFVDEGSPLHRDIGKIIEAAYRAGDLVNQILAFSR